MFLKLVMSLILGYIGLANNVKIDIGEPHYNFVIDTDTKTAILTGVRVGMSERFDAIIPSSITWCGNTYVITDIQPNAFDDAMPRLQSVKLPETIRRTAKNKDACQTVVDRSCIPLLEKLRIVDFFKSIHI